MDHITKIPDDELKRGDPPIDPGDFEDKPATKSKVVTAKEKKPPVTSTASTKDVKAK